ncbi:MAG TPA: D-alanyl-D-alanine carboxypeptidase family protein [Bacillota bacterium]|nr:D-alanyl-D-alanine carboxypeptidase family protein [Bacillota bacterium]
MGASYRHLASGLAFLLALVISAGPLSARPATGPAVRSPSALLMEVGSGEVLWARGADTRVAPASITKLMTLLLAYEALAAGAARLDDTVVASEAAAGLGGTQIWLHPGERMALGDVLRAVAVGSANDAAAALAEHLAGSEAEFVARMNERARDLGMAATRFQNSHGLDHPDHYTSAADVARLSRELVLRFPAVLELTAQYLAYVRQELGAGGRTEILNRNRLVRFYPGADGLKTGWTTRAGYCVAATAVREDTRFLAVVMGSASRTERDADARTLLSHGFSNFVAVRGAAAGEVVSTLPIMRGQVARIDVVAGGDLGVVVLRGKERGVERVVLLPERLTAPVAAGSPVGEIALFLDGQELGRVPLIAAISVESLSWLSMVWRLVLLLFPAS